MLSVSAAQSVSQINNLQGLSSHTATQGTTAKIDGNLGFGDLVQKFIQQTNAQQAISDAAIDSFVTGKSDNIQQVVLAIAEAEMSFQFFMEVRNKVIESYNELLRLQF